jgi:hypothetical protein
MGLEKFEARLVVSIVSIDVGVERSGVDDQRDEPNSAARISSIRSEISVRPLAPAPAARSRLRPVRPPRCASIASLVISEIVVPRRCASWRRRASRSSGNFTVVRIMYASIPDDRRNSSAGSRWAGARAQFGQSGGAMTRNETGATGLVDLRCWCSARAQGSDRRAEISRDRSSAWCRGWPFSSGPGSASWRCAST